MSLKFGGSLMAINLFKGLNFHSMPQSTHARGNELRLVNETLCYLFYNVEAILSVLTITASGGE